MSDRRQIRILVTCVGGTLVYDTISALRSAPDFAARIVGIDADPGAAGRLLCDDFVVLPAAKTDPERWLAALDAAVAERGIEVVIVLSDAEALALSGHRERFAARGVRCSVSPRRTVEDMVDKFRLLTRMDAAGIDAGPFRRVDGHADIGPALADLGYPKAKVVLKPRRSSGSRGVLIVDAAERRFRSLLPGRFCGVGDVDAVIAAMAAERQPVGDLVAVPYWDGPVFDVDCIARDGQVIDSCARLRQLRNPLSPTSTGHKIVLEPRVLRVVRDVAAALGVDGAGDFDVVLAGGDRPLVFDAGARFSGSVGGSVTAGANFPAQLVRVLAGMPVEPLRPVDGTVVRPFVTMAAIPAANELDFL